MVCKNVPRNEYSTVCHFDLDDLLHTSNRSIHNLLPGPALAILVFSSSSSPSSTILADSIALSATSNEEYFVLFSYWILLDTIRA